MPALCAQLSLPESEQQCDAGGVNEAMSEQLFCLNSTVPDDQKKEYTKRQDNYWGTQHR